MDVVLSVNLYLGLRKMIGQTHGKRYEIRVIYIFCCYRLFLCTHGALKNKLLKIGCERINY